VTLCRPPAAPGRRHRLPYLLCRARELSSANCRPQRLLDPVWSDPAMAAKAYDWHDRVAIDQNIAITLAPTRHWSARNLSDRYMSLWASFVIEAPAGRIYFVGDSSYGEGRHLSRCAKALRPVHARAFTDRRLRAALVHGRPAHESGGVREGVYRLRRRAGARPSLRHLSHRRADRCAACCVTGAEIPAERFATLWPGQVWRF
jgi:Beta-lactamase superfamily domain